MATPSTQFVHRSPSMSSPTPLVGQHSGGTALWASSWDAVVAGPGTLLLLLFQLLMPSAAHAQAGFTNDERKLVAQAVKSVFEQCMREPLFAPGAGAQNATSFDLNRFCTCKRDTFEAEITPGLLRRNSAPEGAALGQAVHQHCQAEEFLSSFTRDCPAVVGRTSDLDTQARRGRRLANAGGTQALCPCLVGRMRKLPPAEVQERASSGVSMIASARRTSTPIGLDTVVDEGDLAACGWRLETVAMAPQANRALAVAPAKDDAVLEKSDLVAIGKVIDIGFAQWSTQWMWDRYLPGSVVLTENKSRNGVNLVRGTFKFSRGPQVATIPFASTVRKQPAQWVVTTLCYNDTTSGMTDCTDSGVSAGVRNFMGLAILGGLAAAIGGYDGPRETQGEARYREHDERRREQENREERARRDKAEQDRLDRDWSKMFEPNPMLPPPATIN